MSPSPGGRPADEKLADRIPLNLKLGQMLMVGFRGATVEECGAFLEQVARHHVGGVWITDTNAPMCRMPGNIRSPDQVRKLTAALHEAADGPLFISIDAEGGQVIRIKEQYGFPRFLSPREVGLRNDPAFTRQHAGLLAATLADLGVNFNLAPTVDLHRDGNPVIGDRGRALSEHPNAITLHAAAFIEAHHEHGILTALKHFPGHGTSTTDSHLEMVDVSRTWSDADLAPYRDLLARGLVDSVLSAHVFVRQLDYARPATLSPAILTGLLRERLGFDGVILSDDLNMGAIQRYYNADDATAEAINAGVDIIVHGNVLEYDEHIVEHTVARLRRLVDSGRITEERIDQSFQRIMCLKEMLA